MQALPPGSGIGRIIPVLQQKWLKFSVEIGMVGGQAAIQPWHLSTSAVSRTDSAG